MEALQAALGRPDVEFHPGVSYRNLMIYRGQPGEMPASPTRPSPTRRTTIPTSRPPSTCPAGRAPTCCAS